MTSSNSMIYYSEIIVRRMPPPRVRVRANRNGTPSRSPTPNRPEEDPFIMSPETRRQKARQEQYLEQQKKANERAKRYAKKFKNFQNNTVNHLQTNAPNFKNKLRNMNNPTYLFSDALNNRNGKIRHVYPRDYLNKVFKNKTIHRGPHTGVPTDPSMMRNYEAGVNTINNTIFQNQKKLLIQVYGREGYFNTNLQTLHVTAKLKPHHRDFTVRIHTLFKTYKNFIYDFLRMKRTMPLPEWYTLSEAEITKIQNILKIIHEHARHIETLDKTIYVFKRKIIFILYKKNNAYPQSIINIINRHKEFFNQFKNLLNL